MRRDPLVLPASSLGLTLTGPPGLARARPPLATPARSSQRPHPPDSHRSADSPGSRQHHSQHPSTIAGHPSPLITASSPTGLSPVRRLAITGPGSRQHHSQHPSTIAGHPSPLITASLPTVDPPSTPQPHHRHAKKPILPPSIHALRPSASAPSSGRPGWEGGSTQRCSTRKKAESIACAPQFMADAEPPRGDTLSSHLATPDSTTWSNHLEAPTCRSGRIPRLRKPAIHFAISLIDAHIESSPLLLLLARPVILGMVLILVIASR
jgi:hypothetical protein